MAPQFKKLTDCPENLREAIDWLIQVRHGGDKTGLEHLAQALKKLIDEAISKAKETITHKRRRLDCANDYYEHSYCTELNEKCSKAREELKEVESDGNSLANKEELESQIKLYEANKEDCRKDHYIGEQRKQDIRNEIDEATDVISKLEEFAKDLKNSKDDNNILVKLCSGLETFVGYKDGNYTGDGIVYGDCDRLRDSILMFLHGVLESVKNYQGIDIYRASLNSIAENVLNAVHKNDKPFNEVIPKVISGIENYFTKVTEHNALVTNNLEELSDRIDSALAEFESAKSQTLADQLRQLKTNTDLYHEIIKDAEEALEDINEELKMKVKTPMSIILQSVKNLQMSAKNEGLEEECANVDEELKSMPTKVNLKVEAILKQFVTEQKSNVDGLKKHIEIDFEIVLQAWIRSVDAALVNLEKQGEKNINALHNIFEKEIGVLHRALKQQIETIDISKLPGTSEFQKAFHHVESELMKLNRNGAGDKGIVQNTEDKIKTALQSFVQSANGLKNNVMSVIKQPLSDWVSNNKDASHTGGIAELEGKVTGYVADFQSNYKLVHQQLERIKEIVHIESEQKLDTLVTNITSTLEMLHDKVLHGLQGMKGRIEYAMQGVVTALQKGIKQAAGDDSGVGATWLIQGFRDNLGGSSGDAKTLYKWADAARSNGSELHTALQEFYNKDPNFSIFRKVLTALDSLKAKGDPDLGDGKNFFDALTKDLKDKVAKTALVLDSANAPIVKGKIATIMQQYHTHVGQQGATVSENSIHAKINAVSDKVSQLGNAYSNTTSADGILSGLTATLPDQMSQLKKKIAEVIHKVFEANRGLDNTVKLATQLHSQLETEERSGFDEKFRDLRAAVKLGGTQFEQVTIHLKAVLEKTKRLLSDLEGLSAKIKSIPEKGTNALLAEFRKAVQQYKKELQSSGNSKKKRCIQEAKAALDNVLNRLESDVNQVTKRIGEVVTQAFENVTQHVQTQYASSNNAQIDALKRCVAAQKLEITTIMDNDFKTGLKGFIKTISGVAANSLKISCPDNKIVELKDVSDVSGLSVKFKTYVEQILDYIIDQLNLNSASGRVGSSNRSTSSMSPLYDSKVSGIYAIYKNVGDVMQALGISKSFNHAIIEKIHEAYEAITNLRPSKFFSKSSNSLLDIFKSGIVSFVEELQNVYVSKYAGSTDTFNWGAYGNSDKCAKVCLTIFEILHRDLTKLKIICEGGCSFKQINLQITLDGGRKVVNPLGDFFNQRGYKVPSDVSTQDAELRNETNIKGEQIKDLLYKNYNIFASLHSGDDNALYDGPLVQLYNNLLDYNSVCHLRDIKSANSPNNAFQMLCWLSGLQYNPTYHPLKEYMKTFFKKAEKHKDTEYSKIQFVDLKVEATTPFSARDTVSALRLVTVKSHDILTTLLGHGHAGGIYACDFKTNPGNLSYPSDSGACFDLLVEILLRLNHQLSFLYEQCCHTTKVSGWSDCWYGKGVGGSNWQCNDLKCTECMGADKCRNNTICGLKSPLQSFLEDGLKGFLPHSFTKLGCKLECSVSNHNGIPCKTPMGFSDIGTVASHRQTGQRIKDVLRSFCGNKNSPLNQLCSYLICLLRTPPRTLGEMFAFYYTFLHDWNDSGEHRKDGFNNAVIKANFKNSNTRFDITSMFKSTDHAENHLKGDLYSLISCSNTYIPARPCGPYMRPLCIFSRDMYSKEYSGYYLSWVVYLTETFYDLLKKLYEDCNKSCGSKGSKCYDKSCVRSCPISRDPSSSSHDPLCKSMVHCTSTLPILCKYGFYFGSATLASGSKGDTMKRTCKDFILQLRNVCDVNSVLAKLVNITIPQYLFTIRGTFFYTLVALWLLSLLYLLHIMVIRLDLLHIKSHLHSPSSHRIAAQSLLAAARVNKLGRVFYLQP